MPATFFDGNTAEAVEGELELLPGRLPIHFGRHLSDLYGRNGFVNWLESSWRWIAVALVLSFVGTWLMLTKGVLAHDVGHLVHRHSLRILLQNAASAVISASLTGDLTNVTALSATVPTVLMQAKYSRDFEREADGFAVAYLTDRGLDTSALSPLLRRLEKEDRSPGGGTPSDWFSSHPRSADRVPADK